MHCQSRVVRDVCLTDGPNNLNEGAACRTATSLCHEMFVFWQSPDEEGHQLLSLKDMSLGEAGLYMICALGIILWFLSGDDQLKCPVSHDHHPLNVERNCHQSSLYDVFNPCKVIGE